MISVPNVLQTHSANRSKEQHTFFIGNLNVSEAIINVFSCNTLHFYMIFYCSTAIPSSSSTSLPHHDFLAVSTANIVGVGCMLKLRMNLKKLKLKCAIKFMFHGMNISLISSIFLSFVFTIIQSISEVAEEEKKMYVNFSFELILVSSYILQFSRVTLFVLYIQVHFFWGLFHAFFHVYKTNSKRVLNFF